MSVEFHTCTQCGKKFYPGMVADWAYKIKKDNYTPSQHILWFCSWGCFSKYKKEHQKKKKYEEPLY